MPFLFDMPYGRRPSQQDKYNWNPEMGGDAYSFYTSGLTTDEWLARQGRGPLQPSSGLGGTPPASIGTYPPTSGGGAPPFVGHGNDIANPGFHAPTNPALITPYGGGPLSPAIAGLIQPGLVPDIARMSAEITAGRGIGGSPAAGSTAVKMSEQNYLQRLGLANQLLTGEAGRALPYQITPLQSAELANRLAVAGMHNFPSGGSYGYNPSRSGSGYGGGNFAGNYVSPYTPYRSTNYGGGLDTHGSIPGVDYGGGGGASPSLDDMLRELGIFGEDNTGAEQPQPPDFDWQMWE
jgi:hypothetical protein